MFPFPPPPATENQLASNAQILDIHRDEADVLERLLDVLEMVDVVVDDDDDDVAKDASAVVKSTCPMDLSCRTFQNSTRPPSPPANNVSSLLLLLLDAVGTN